jgi:ABC-type transporter Mla subunit MlaD
MGFAVVADEVRSLAQRSANAARETAEKIENSITKSERGVQISLQVAKNFEEIMAKVRRVDDLVASIASASKEQSDGIGQLNNAVGEIDQVTQSNAASAEESAAAAQELNRQADVLNEALVEMQKLMAGADEPTGKVEANPVPRRWPTTATSVPSSRPWFPRAAIEPHHAVNNSTEKVFLRNKYNPADISAVFVLEAPPPALGYFYDPQGRVSEVLFRACPSGREPMLARLWSRRDGIMTG